MKGSGPKSASCLTWADSRAASFSDDVSSSQNAEVFPMRWLFIVASCGVQTMAMQLAVYFHRCWFPPTLEESRCLYASVVLLTVHAYSATYVSTLTSRDGCILRPRSKAICWFRWHTYSLPFFVSSAPRTLRRCKAVYVIGTSNVTHGNSTVTNGYRNVIKALVNFLACRATAGKRSNTHPLCSRERSRDHGRDGV